MWGKSVVVRSGRTQCWSYDGAMSTLGSASMKRPELLQRGEAKAMWGLCWRMILFAPVGILGVVAFTLVMGLWMLPPVYAAILIYSGDYLWAVLALIGWGLCL